MAQIEIASENFIHSILYATKKEYKDSCLYLPRSRSVKLVCFAADYLDYDLLNRGWYKHGYFSFITNEIIKNLPFRGSLLKTKIDMDKVDREISDQIIKFLKDNKSHFLSKKEDFLHWVHYDVAPEHYKKFYKLSDNFLQSFEDISYKKISSGYEPYDEIADIISNYYPCLKHVDNDVLETFSDFVDLVENILLASKIRNTHLTGAKTQIRELYDLFEKQLYRGLPPFKQTLIGNEKNLELQIYEKNIQSSLVYSIERLLTISTIMERRKLIPTISEFESII
jgi:hypothetical protein